MRDERWEMRDDGSDFKMQILHLSTLIIHSESDLSSSDINVSINNIMLFSNSCPMHSFIHSFIHSWFMIENQFNAKFEVSNWIIVQRSMIRWRSLNRFEVNWKESDARINQNQLITLIFTFSDRYIYLNN
jgi:hypothetical protein